MRASREHVYTMSPSLYDKEARKSIGRRNMSKLGYASWGQADACGWGALSSLDLLRFVSAVPTLLGPEVWHALTQRPMINNDAGQGVPAPMGLGWGVVEAGGNKGINHGGGWPGQRSFAGLRPDGGSLAVLVNSDDDTHVNMIVGAAPQFFSRAGRRAPQIAELAGLWISHMIRQPVAHRQPGDHETGVEPVRCCPLRQGGRYF